MPAASRRATSAAVATPHQGKGGGGRAAGGFRSEGWLSPAFKTEAISTGIGFDVTLPEVPPGRLQVTRKAGIRIFPVSNACPRKKKISRVGPTGAFPSRGSGLSRPIASRTRPGPSAATGEGGATVRSGGWITLTLTRIGSPTVARVRSTETSTWIGSTSTAISAAHGTARTAASRNHAAGRRGSGRSEEHTSELQSRLHLVCRLLLEKKKTS